MKATSINTQFLEDRKKLSKQIRQKAKELKNLLDAALDLKLEVMFNNIYFDTDSFDDGNDIVLITQKFDF